MLTGILRYANTDLLLRLALGWQLVPTDLGPTHGEYSVYVWWCCGDCSGEEVP